MHTILPKGSEGLGADCGHMAPPVTTLNHTEALEEERHFAQGAQPALQQPF